MNGHGQSDRSVVPPKSPNKAGQPAAEATEGSDLTKGNAGQTNTPRAQDRNKVPTGLERVRHAARKSKDVRFTTLLHHVTKDLLRHVFRNMNRKATPGVDGVTWQTYEQDLEANLDSLLDRLHRGAYRAKPSRRTYIPKADGRQRPLGVASLEDKILQGAVVKVMNAIYEADFLGFSYGFRPGRHQHQALDAVAVAIDRRKVNWVLDADIRGFFDAIDHGLLMTILEHRIADRRLLRLIQKWLNAGVLEDGSLTRSKQGSPQGATISPLLANIYLHYVFDTWAHHWRTTEARGDVIIVRYADDTVVGFQHRDDAERFLAALHLRMAEYGLELNTDKTRLIEFGRFAAGHREKRGEGKPETFNFLGLTHICGKTRNGRFLLTRHTMTKRLRAKLAEVKATLSRRKHEPLPAVAAWLAGVVRGYFNYHAVPTNTAALRAFREEIVRAWYHALRRRSQKTRINWERMTAIATRWLPRPRIQHPWPSERLAVRPAVRAV